MTSRDSGDALARIDALAAIARNEPAPGVDVVDDVLRRLRHTHAVDRSMVWFTAAAAAAAAIVLVVSLPYFTGALDPLSTFIEATAASPL